MVGHHLLEQPKFLTWIWESVCDSNIYSYGDEDEEVRLRLRIMHRVMQLSGMLGAHLDLSLPNIIMIISTQTVDHSKKLTQSSCRNTLYADS